jgi:hypothetical protein
MIQFTNSTNTLSVTNCPAIFLERGFKGLHLQHTRDHAICLLQSFAKYRHHWKNGFLSEKNKNLYFVQI